MPSSNDSLVIAIELKTKCRFHAAAILQSKYLNKICELSNLYYPTSFQHTKLSADSVASTSQVPASALLSLLIVGNRN